MRFGTQPRQLAAGSFGRGQWPGWSGSPAAAPEPNKAPVVPKPTRALETDPIDRTGHTVTNPKVLIEVLSPSTTDYDRGEKLRHYRAIPSLEATVLFDHEAQRAELWQRTGTDWTFIESIDRISIAAIGCELVLADVYRDPLGSA